MGSLKDSVVPEFKNMKFRIKNVQRYDIREEPLAYIAVLELIQNV